ncbi:Dihydroorotate dehydrogenase B (NAD(+)), electron transfer subunit [Methanimicrococcus stummii]|uniref:Probable dihydroorotate dehydrogenase B (NAD(+)), electron transfer subunit n=1 Tax=Methanimicrococcus stummii TaxID=3028294 RepID=A0AA96V8Q4_9EURY|nr:dihydroorotate dehydrogenase electron transfer subunit [Methanimicrococcus sp. Es2]WNY27926.1 Dihydroorotate dehydrogenase B (NAD(+)), electron transfer subunit [Methanimicrococcus sp. Es2]
MADGNESGHDSNCKCHSGGYPVNAKIIDVIDETNTGKRTLLFDRGFENMKPGNFCMVWIRGVDEIPLGCAYKNGVTFQTVGPATNALFDLKAGDSVGLRGPLGNPFTLPESGENVLIIAGGIGAAPLAPLAEKSKEIGANVTIILGARSEADIIFEERFGKTGEVLLTTDDGTKGRKGFVTDVLAEADLEKIDRIYVCGPEMMMKFVMKILIEKDALSKAEFSMERYFKCGIGVCGACCIDTLGVRVCKDGPVFKATTLLDSEFGKYHRDASGKRITY